MYGFSLFSGQHFKCLIDKDSGFWIFAAPYFDASTRPYIANLFSASEITHTAW